MKLRSWPEIGSDGDILLTPYVPEGITGDDDDERLEVSGAVRPIYGSLGVKRLRTCL